jgi:hypothetical protein
MKTPRILLLFIGIIAVYYLFRFDYWTKDLVIRSDGYAYYGYIHGTLVKHDPLNTFHGKLEGLELHRSWMHEGLPGKYLPKMTMGIAYAWVPGFYMAHLISPLLGYPQDGWSIPYQLSVGITSIFFLLIGCWATWQLVAARFSNTIAHASVFLLYLGTNLLQYGSVDASMSHVYSFALIALFAYASDRWIGSNRSVYFFFAAFLLGWIVLIRPTNIIVGLYLPWMLYASESSLKKLWTPQLLWAACMAFIPILPQLVFWKLAAGEWVHYSYEQEAFYWASPHILEGLFSYRNGWLLYTPVMALAVGGLFALHKTQPHSARMVTVLLGLHVYITFSWWCWYYGGSLSIRPMIDVYALLALPLAASLVWILNRSWMVQTASLIVLVLLVWNNTLQVRHLNNGIISGSAMTKKAFWATFMAEEQPNYLYMVAAYRDADTDRLRLGKPERTLMDTVRSATIGEWSGERHLDPDHAFSSQLIVLGEVIPRAEKLSLEVLFDVHPEDLVSNQLVAVVSFQHGDKNYLYQAADVKFAGAMHGQRSTCAFYVRKPYGFPPEGEMQVYAWFRGKGSATLYGMRVEPIEVDYAEEL